MSSLEEAQKGNSMSKVSRSLVAVGSLFALTFGMSPAKAATLNPDLCSPSQTFTTNITNRYAPMQPGQVSTFFGVEDGTPVGLTIAVTSDTADFYGGAIVTRDVVETQWVDTDADGERDSTEKFIEISHNYFAQTAAGTVCYFGEDVMIFAKNGKFKGDTGGSWRADDPDNAPGIFMPANPRKGDSYQMEFAPGIAEDQVTIEDITTVNVSGHQYRRALKVNEFSQLDGDSDLKYYAPNVGLIIDEVLQLTDFSVAGG